MIWGEYFFLFLLGLLGLILGAVLTLRTRVSAQVNLTEAEKELILEAKLLFRAIKLRFALQPNDKKVVLLFGNRRLFCKHLAAQKKTVSSAKTKKNSPKKKSGFWKQVQTFRPIWKELKLFLKRLVQLLHFSQLKGDLALGLGSPFKTGQLMGIWFAIRPWIPVQGLMLRPDFLHKRAEGWLSAELSLRLIGLLWAAAPFYWRFRKIHRSGNLA